MPNVPNVFFPPNRLLPHSFLISVNGNSILPVSGAKMLGVILCPFLFLTSHTSLAADPTSFHDLCWPLTSFICAVCMPCLGCCGDLWIPFYICCSKPTTVGLSPHSSQYCCQKPTSVFCSRNITRRQSLGIKRTEFYYFKAKEVRVGYCLQNCRPARGKRLIWVVSLGIWYVLPATFLMPSRWSHD